MGAHAMKQGKQDIDAAPVTAVPGASSIRASFVGRFGEDQARALAGKLLKYGVPPKRVFRKMGLGKFDPNTNTIRVIAGFRFKWWVPDFAGPVEPIVVNARVLRMKATSAATKPEGAE